MTQENFIETKVLNTHKKWSPDPGENLPTRHSTNAIKIIKINCSRPPRKMIK